MRTTENRAIENTERDKEPMEDDQTERIGSGGGYAKKLTAVATLIVVVVVFAALVLVPRFVGPVDSAGASRSQAYKVSPSQLELYCPSRMALADADQYGDAQFRASGGDISSSARYGAFGSVYRGTVGPLTNGSEANESVLGSADSYDGDTVKTLAGDVNDGPTIFTSKLLGAGSGTGPAASVGSWATKGDLQGVSASTCVTPSLVQHLLLPATSSGHTEQLVVANLSSKATSLQILAHGAKSDRQLALSTSSTLNVTAHGEASIDLSAAVPGEDGVFVTLRSVDTPVAAVVRSVAMDGLNAKGSDYIPSLGVARAQQVMPAVRSGDHVSLSLYGTSSGTASLSWVTEKGESRAKSVDLTAGKVAVTDLGKAPAGTLALVVSAAHPLWAQAGVERSDKDGHADFAFVPASGSAASSAIAKPEHMEGTMVFANRTDGTVKASLKGYTADGKETRSRSVEVDAHAAVSVSDGDLGDGAALFKLDGGHDLVWGMRLSQNDVDGASLADVAYLQATALEPQNVEIVAEHNGSIVH